MQTKRGSVLIYAIFLSALASAVGYVLFMKADVLIENLSYQNYDAKLSRNAAAKADLAFKWATFLNANGEGFAAARDCPEVTLSGSIAGGTTENVQTYLGIEDNLTICRGTSVSGRILKLFYNADYTSFDRAWYVTSVNLAAVGSSLTGTTAFSDPDAKIPSLTLPSTFSNIDGNANSDDYRPGSTGSVSYPDGYSDDDVLSRKTAYGYVRKNAGWINVFWENPKIAAFIDSNTNNSDAASSTPSQTSSGYLFFDIDRPHSIRVVEFDTGAYLESGELRKSGAVLEAVAGSGAIGYLQNDLSYSGSRSNGDNAKLFDFKNRDYAIFISYSGTTVTGSGDTFLKYRLSSENAYGSGIYIQPLRDDGSSTMTFLWGDIVIDFQEGYRSKILEYSAPKAGPNDGIIFAQCGWVWEDVLDGLCFAY